LSPSRRERSISIRSTSLALGAINGRRHSNDVERNITMTTNQMDNLARVINVDDLMSRCMGNLEFVERILAIFQSRCEADLQELEEAVAASDFVRVQRIAHRLKGACANAGASDLSARASELWTAANKEFTDVVSARFAQFKQEWNQCAAVLGHEHAGVEQPTLAGA
jgi:HPt (histidine-containing phosphotransfer) domain-containing protein